MLSPFSKTLERIVYDQLMTFLEKYNIHNKYQFGFRKGHSTEQAILEITENLKTSIDNNLITCGVFIDFSKAFDTVNHEILLAKLIKYGLIKYLIPISDIHSYNTRLSASGNFYRPKVRTNYGQSSIKFIISKLWNCVPPYLKHLNIEAFKIQYKQFLLSCLI